MFGRGTSARLSEQLWTTDLDCQSANEANWATGRAPSLNRAGWKAARLDGDLKRIDRRLRRRAGPMADEPLAALAQMPETDRVRAAAALRVVDTDVFLLDGESLQPGDELPAVGFYAERTEI